MYLEGGVKHHQFGAGGDGVVAAVALHEVHVDQPVLSLRQRTWGHSCLFLSYVILNSNIAPTGITTNKSRDLKETASL